MVVMFSDEKGPINSFKWGRFVINGTVHSADGMGVGKDICILDGEIFPWKARKGHRLEKKMVDFLSAADIQILVIGNGVNGALKVPDKTRKAIQKMGIPELIIEKTPEACKIYNRLVSQGKQVAFLAHGTC
jgi:hypothetical protein